MTEQQKALVQDSWAQVAPHAEATAALFYNRLFELDPGLKPLFAQSNLAEQGQKLMQMITVAVKGLDALEQLVPAVQELGRRHTGYGVLEEHYEIVGTALLDTLARGLEGAFTAETKEAWATTYNTLARVMKEAAYDIPKTA